MPRNTEQSDTPAGAWKPSATAQPMELAEFHKFQTKGETVLGRVERITSRPDPMHQDRLMQGLVLTPAVVVLTDGKRQAYASLAIGFSAHLQLLVGDSRQAVGNSYAFVYDGQRPSDMRGKNPSHQFQLYQLSAAEFSAEVRATDPENAELLLNGAEQKKLPF